MVLWFYGLGLGLGVQGLRLRVFDLRFKVQGIGCRVEGFGLRVAGVLGTRVPKGSGFRAPGF